MNDEKDRNGERKHAPSGALVENREGRAGLPRDPLAATMEGAALIRAIKEGENSGHASRDDVLAALDGAQASDPMTGNRRR